MYRISQLERAELERQLKEGLNSLASSSPPPLHGLPPVLFVEKQTSELRMVLDWRVVECADNHNDACATF